MLESELKSLRMDVMIFRFGEECLKELYLNPDLVILDYIFVHPAKNVLSGLEILTQIRSKNGDVPVIMLSGQDSGSTVLELIRLGIEEYIIKDADFLPQIRNAVLNALNLQ